MKPKSSPNQGGEPFPTARKRGQVKEILEAAIAADFDPTASFREKFGHTPPDLAMVLEVRKSGFENYVKAQSISPSTEDPIYLSFTSEIITPVKGEYFSFRDGFISIICTDTLNPHKIRAILISEDAFSGNSKKDHIT